MGLGILFFIGFALSSFYPFASGLQNEPLFFPLLVLFGLAFLSRRAVLMAIAMISNLLIRVHMADPNLPYYILSFSFGLCCYATMVHHLCPRCKLPIGLSWSGVSAVNQKPWCPACGRSHEGVRPFMHLLKSEPWDGEYHDEGGGQQTDSARRWTERMREKWQKRRSRK